jgi:hypothetical protein
MPKYNLIGVGTDAKTVKGNGAEYLTGILYLAPADIVEGINLCIMAVLAGCKEGCLNTQDVGLSTTYRHHVSERLYCYETFPNCFMSKYVKT